MPGRCTTYAEPMKMAGTSTAASGAGSLIMADGATRSAITLLKRRKLVLDLHCNAWVASIVSAGGRSVRFV